MIKAKTPIKFLSNGLVMIMVGTRMIITNWEERFINVLKDIYGSDTYMRVTDFSFSELEISVKNVKPAISEKARNIFVELINAGQYLEKLIIDVDFNLNIETSELQESSKINSLEIISMSKDIEDHSLCKFDAVEHLSICDIDKMDIQHILSIFKNVQHLKLFGKHCSSQSINMFLDEYGDRLIELYIQSNDEGAFNNIGKACNLESLTIDSFEVDTLPPCLYELPKLISLDITRTQISENTFQLAMRISEAFPNITNVLFPTMTCDCD